MDKKNLILLIILVILVLTITGSIIIISFNNDKKSKDLISESEDSISESEDPISESQDSISVGDYVTYTLNNKALTEETINDLQLYSGFSLANENYLDNYPIVQDSLNWRILSIDGNKITLISDMPSKSKVSLCGYNGYNNAIYLLNKICFDLYSSDYGTARSLNMNDVIDTFSFDCSSIDGYGKSFTLHDSLNNKNFYPNALLNEKKVSSLRNLQCTQSSIVDGFSNKSGDELKVTNTYWRRKIDENSFKKKIYYDLFADSTHYESYALSNRCTSVSELAQYSIFAFNLYEETQESYLEDNCLYNSKGDMSNCWISFRPVITLDDDVEVDACEGNNSLTNPHTLTKKSES